MGEMVFFTDNYQDHSTREGYQFEFYCHRCGNGYSSSFQKSLSGFGGQMRGKAVGEMKPYFKQCHRCGQWVCGQICWNDQRGLCTTCAPKLDQEIAGMQ